MDMTGDTGTWRFANRPYGLLTTMGFSSMREDNLGGGIAITGEGAHEVTSPSSRGLGKIRKWEGRCGQGGGGMGPRMREDNGGGGDDGGRDGSRTAVFTGGRLSVVNSGRESRFSLWNDG